MNRYFARYSCHKYIPTYITYPLIPMWSDNICLITIFNRITRLESLLLSLTTFF